MFKTLKNLKNVTLIYHIDSGIDDEVDDELRQSCLSLNFNEKKSEYLKL